MHYRFAEKANVSEDHCFVRSPIELLCLFDRGVTQMNAFNFLRAIWGKLTHAFALARRELDVMNMLISY